MGLLEYPLTRPISLRRIWKALIAIGALVWITFITLVNVAAVGYELVPVTSGLYNSSTLLWYEHFMPTSSWIPKSRTCEWTLIKLLEDITTDIRGYFTYCFYSYRDAKTGSSVDGMIYEGDTIVNCSLQLFQLMQPVYDPFEIDVLLLCNTTAMEFFILQTGYNVVSSGVRGIPEKAALLVSNMYPPAHSLEPLNITSVLELWAAVTHATLDLIAPVNGMSILLPSVEANGLSSLGITYSGKVQNGSSVFATNFIAGDFWTLNLIYTYQDQVQANTTSITFLPTGEIDATRTSPDDLNLANAVIAPTLQYMQTAMKNDSFDVWKFFNFLIVSYYWVFLADFGHVAPTSYSLLPDGADDFSQPGFLYPTTNNLFINETLFEIYSNYLRTVILPFLQLSAPNLTLPDFLPITDSNSLQSIDATIIRSYTCVERQLKGWGSAIISVLVADYALIGGPYKVLIFVLGWMQKRKDLRNGLSEEETATQSNDQSDGGQEMTEDTRFLEG